MRIAGVLSLLIATMLGAGGARAALELECPERVPEGTAFTLVIHGDAKIDSLRVTWLDRVVRPRLEAGEARLLLGLGMRERLEGEAWTLRVSAWRGAEEEMLLRSIRRGPRDYPEQHLEVARKYSELGEEDLARHERERAAVRAATGRTSPDGDWQLPFTRPVAGRITSDFGLRRFFNGEPKKPHSGVDLAGARGTPVRACADGVVVLAEEHFFAGRSVYVDHGQGLVSMYFHLEEILVAAGQRLAGGETVGLVGDSGRVTGPHLHWGLSVLGQLVDPLPLAE